MEQEDNKGVSQALINKFKNLPQFRDKTEEEVRLALLSRKDRVKISKKDVKRPTYSKAQIDIEDLFSAKDEKEYATELLDKYLKEFSLESISDKNLLKQLIYLEVFQKCRLQEAAEDFQKQSGSVPLQILDSIHKNLDKIIQLKNSLGLTRESKAKAEEGYEAFRLLMKKAEVWRKNNQASRSLICPNCSKTMMLKIRTDIWEAQKHPFFRDRILGNAHLIKLYKENKLSKEDLAAIFETSNDYVDWLVERWEKLE